MAKNQKRWDEIKNDLFKLASEQDKEKLHAETEGWTHYIEELESKLLKMNIRVQSVLSNLAYSKAINEEQGQFAHAQAYGNAYNMVKSVFSGDKTFVAEECENYGYSLCGQFECDVCPAQFVYEK